MIFELTDKQWALVAPIVARHERMETRGRPRCSDRAVLSSILHVIQMGGSWRRLPKGVGFPSFQTCFRRYYEWAGTGRLDKVLEVLAKDMEERGKIPLRSCFMDEVYEFIRDSRGLYLTEGNDAYENPDLPWDVRTRLLFQSSYTWKKLLDTRSAWLSARMPDDLAVRSTYKEFTPEYC